VMSSCEHGTEYSGSLHGDQVRGYQILKKLSAAESWLVKTTTWNILTREATEFDAISAARNHKRHEFYPSAACCSICFNTLHCQRR
jgi:hypothetical protein